MEKDRNGKERNDRSAKALAELRNKKRMDIQRREAIENIDFELPYLEKKLELKKKDLQLMKEVFPVMMDGFKKLEFNYEYEKNNKYTDFMFKRQEILNDTYILDVEHDIQSIEKQIKKLKEQREELKSQLEFVEGDRNE